MNFFPSVKWYTKVFFILFVVFIFMNLSINDNKFKVKLAITSSQIQNGMTGKNFNEEYNGLYFIMPYKGEQSFWMRDCLVPLDIIIIGFPDAPLPSCQEGDNAYLSSSFIVEPNLID